MCVYEGAKKSLVLLIETPLQLNGEKKNFLADGEWEVFLLIFQSQIDSCHGDNRSGTCIDLVSFFLGFSIGFDDFSLETAQNADALLIFSLRRTSGAELLFSIFHNKSQRRQRAGLSPAPLLGGDWISSIT